MNPFILCLFLVQSAVLWAQPRLDGLGPFKLTITTPDSLHRPEFKEDDQSYVKGTIALPCEHIRSFRAARVMVEGIAVTNVVVYFYDNRLFKLTCDYSKLLETYFNRIHGPGTVTPAYRAVFCTAGKPVLIEGTAWDQANVKALAIRTSGYNADCELENKRRFDVSSVRLLSLASDCELKHLDPVIEEFTKNLR